MMRPAWIAVLIAAVLTPQGLEAQGTKLWTVSRYDEMERGTTENAAIRSDGRLESGLAATLLYATGKSYIWSLANDPQGFAYLGLGGTSAGAAAVMKVSPDGKARQIFESKELGVQALRPTPDGTLLVATSPEGKVYRMPQDGGSPTVVFDPTSTEEKPRYIWDIAVDKAGNAFIATGAPAAVYRVPANGGQPDLLFKTADQHIRSLLLTPDGVLWAGSDGSGVIYRFRTAVAGEKPFAVYAGARREITALAMDKSGDIYAAGVGARGRTTLPPLPVTGSSAVTLTFLPPGSSSAASSNSLLPDGSEIYRISPTGAPTKLVTLKDDVVYSLIETNGTLLAATGNRGRIYRISETEQGQFTDVAHLEASQGMAFAESNKGLLVATSNSGKVFRLSDAATQAATYTSEVFDAGGFAQWGRAEVQGDSPTDRTLYIRSGNVESPLMGWSEWTPIGADGSYTTPPGRYVQWKAVLHQHGTLDSVALNYLQQNLAPVVDEIVVQPGARAGGNPPLPNNVIQITLPSATGAPALPSFALDPASAPLPAQKDKTAITVRWTAHDDNGDDLMFAIWYRGVGEANWRLLKDKISDRFYSFDSALLPDGNYEVKVIASDAPVHTDAESLTGERVSEAFVVDTTPPVPGPLSAQMSGPSKIHATLEARDATSPITHAEYSVDAGPWQYLEPVGKVSDSLSERYDFTADIPASTLPVANPREHVIAVRVYDRYENVTAVKAVVH